MARHQSLRYLQIIPVGLVLWGLDAVATVLDVLATANHYWLDVIIAPGVLVLAYAIALLPALGRLSLGMPGPPPMAPDP